MEGQIERTGKTPIYADYGTMYALCDQQNPPEQWSDLLKKCAPPNGPKPVVIPPYQRKLVWGEEDIDAIVHSKSNLFGTVILATFSEKNPWILIDGLQRFATVTAFLVALYDEVLAPTPNNSTAAPHFESISLQYERLNPVYKHNHDMLMTHGRTGIKNSYKQLFSEVKKYVLEKIKDEPEKFGADMTLTLLQKQIAVDPYHGFTSEIELVNTFLEINSTGVDLSKLDLLRTLIITKAFQLGWSEDSIETVENSFTDVFQPTKTNNFTKLLGTQIYNVMSELQSSDPKFIFPNWDTIDKKTFDDLFEYIETVYSLRKETVSGDKTQYLFPYLAEIFRCGGLPFAAYVWFYYKNHYLKFLEKKKKFQDQLISENIKKMDEQSAKIEAYKTIKKILTGHEESKNLQRELTIEPGIIGHPSEERKYEINKKLKEISDNEHQFTGLFENLPDFLNGDLETTSDSLLFLRAATRRVIDGSIGRTDYVVQNTMNMTYSTLEEVAKALNPEDSAGSLMGNPSEGWLTGRLLTINRRDSQLVFNSCLLPKRGDINLEFNPLIYSNRTGFWNIDHLIPDSDKDENQSGFSNMQHIVNFAPLESDKNNLASAAPCFDKLSPKNLYDQVKSRHEYCEWLVDTHFVNHRNDKKELVNGIEYHPLNIQSKLIEGTDISSERIQKIQEILTSRL